MGKNTNQFDGKPSQSNSKEFSPNSRRGDTTHSSDFDEISLDEEEKRYPNVSQYISSPTYTTTIPSHDYDNERKSLDNNNNNTNAIIEDTRRNSINNNHNNHNNNNNNDIYNTPSSSTQTYPTRENENSPFPSIVKRLSSSLSGSPSSKKRNSKDVLIGRIVHCNNPEKNALNPDFSNNRIKTSRYSIVTFLPKNLYEQFRRVANFYFLIIAIIQLIPGLSPVNSFTTVVPLVLVLTVTAIKEAIEDYKRHVSDNFVNNLPVKVLRNGHFVSLPWKDIVVGDMVRVKKGEGFPADLILINSSSPEGMCYIETSNLDGETNLKLRQALVETTELHNEEALEKFQGIIETEPPNNQIHSFNGNMSCNGKKMPLTLRQALLRGCVLTNTDWIVGVAVYTGKQSKLMQNQTKPPSKRSTLEKNVNWGLLSIFTVMITICIFLTIASVIWTAVNKNKFWFLDFNSSATSEALLNFFTFLITFAVMIPISLYVSLELVKVFQALLINWDEKIWQKENNIFAKARTSNLSEELGQISYIFSDKTGTLTRNQMEFMKCSVGEEVYGRGYTEAQITNAKRNGHPIPIDNSAPLPNADPNFGFKDETFLNDLHKEGSDQSEKIKNFLRLLSVCHTVVPEENEDDPNADVIYQAASPDEGALVSAAKNLGYYFHTRNPDGIVVKIEQKDEYFEILQILEFTSERRRMSVICKTPEGKIMLYCKGADNIIIQRLKSGQESLVQKTLGTLEIFGTDGLRTLTLAEAELDPQFYSKWCHIYHEASVAIHEREEKLAQAAELIEKDLILIGTTAIEDKLQDGVPDTIYNLRQANIHIWVLTGDKQETAINIGFACQLLSNSMDIIVINAHDEHDTKSQLEAALEHKIQKFENSNTQQEIHSPSQGSEMTTTQYGTNMAPHVIDRPELALVIDGLTLTFALNEDNKMLLLELSKYCKSVICCRSTPLQKAQVVRLVRDNIHEPTLAIGDGANDVSMLLSAHVGVGISGQEGMQAVMSSDYKIAEFQYLYRLLLVHGRWDYKRNSKLILYCFYKNMLFSLTQFWLAFFNGFSGQTMYDGWTISVYNVIFTSMPIIIYACFEQDITDTVSERFPQIYKPGQKDESFNLKKLWLWLGDAAYHSLVIFFGTILLFKQGQLLPNGTTGDLFYMGAISYALVVIVANLRLAFEIQYWTYITHIFLWGSIATWFLWMLIYTSIPTFITKEATESQIYWIGFHVMSTPAFWIGIIVIAFICLLPDLVIKVVQRNWWPTPIQILQEIQKYCNLSIRGEDTISLVPPTPQDEEVGFFRKGVHKTIHFGKSVSKGFTGFAFSEDLNPSVALKSCIGRRKRRKPQEIAAKPEIVQTVTEALNEKASENNKKIDLNNNNNNNNDDDMIPFQRIASYHKTHSPHAIESPHDERNRGSAIIENTAQPLHLGYTL